MFSSTLRACPLAMLSMFFSLYAAIRSFVFSTSSPLTRLYTMYNYFVNQVTSNLYPLIPPNNRCTLAT